MKKPRKDGTHIRVLKRIAAKRAKRKGRKKQQSLPHIKKVRKKPRTPVEKAIRQAKVRVKLPEQFSLTGNFENAVGAINRIRQLGREPGYVNFDGIRDVDAPAALMLAAELEVRKIKYRTRYLSNDHNWDADVRHQLMSMGLFDFLDVNPQDTAPGEAPLDEVFVQFVSGFRKLKGEDLDEVLRRSEECMGEQIPESVKDLLGSGMGEAITNTLDHAYAEGRNDKSARWWMSASVNKKSGEIKVVCYDRGLTIPKTITASYKKMKGIVALLRREGGDEGVIKATMLRSISKTRQSFRGRGLKELMYSIDYNGRGRLEIYSRRGMVRYDKAAKSSDGIYSTRKFEGELRGTLIIWSIIPAPLEE